MTRPLEDGKTRYAIHKETDCKEEAFMLFPKKPHFIEIIHENLQTFKKPSEAQIKRIKSRHPDISAMMASCRNSEIKTYAKPDFIQYRNAVYVHHLYQFVRNNHSKLEITAVFNSKRRTKEAVEHELKQILDKATDGVRHEDYFSHSLK